MQTPFLPSTPPAGLGDTVAKVLRKTNLDKIATVYEKVTGKPCNCKQRQEKLNQIFPYNNKG